MKPSRAAACALVGSDLRPPRLCALEARWIDQCLADHAHLRRVDSMTGGEIVGRNSGNYAGILIPYFLPGSDQVREYRLRRDQPDLEYDSAGNLKPRQKYLSPPGRSNMLYLVPGVGQSLLRDPTLPHRGHGGRIQDARPLAPGPPWSTEPAPVSAARRLRRLQLARHDRKNSRAGRQPPGCEGCDPDLDWITWAGRQRRHRL